MAHIVHFGLGNFHRAHQAWYTELANRAGGTQWRITGVSLRSGSVRDIMEPQGFDYTLATSGREKTGYERISVIDDILVANEDRQAILATIASPDTRVITLTITEKGYHLNADTGLLDLSDPSILADLNGATTTVFGFLVQGLQLRQSRTAGPLTVLSCDNLSANGDAMSAAVQAFAQRFDPSLTPYLRENIRFPNCMVDRITPATTQATRADVKANTGWADQAPVATEAFSEWVIEDNFASERPDWDRAGARFVPDVAPFEMRKLRLLNGAHSYLAYAGTLRGHIYVHQAIGDPTLRAGAKAIMDEAAETLPQEMGADTPGYAASLLARFGNPGLHHKLRQIAMDATRKLPIRLVATWKDRQARGLSSPAIETAVACWMCFARGETLGGRTLQDPAAAKVAAICNNARSSGDLAVGLCALIGAPDALAASPGIRDTVKEFWA